MEVKEEQLDTSCFKRIWAVRRGCREKSGGQTTRELTHLGHFLFVLKFCRSKNGSVNHTLPTDQWLMFSQVLG